jgi:hypothetical protein
LKLQLFGSLHFELAEGFRFGNEVLGQLRVKPVGALFGRLELSTNETGQWGRLLGRSWTIVLCRRLGRVQKFDGRRCGRCCRDWEILNWLLQG